MTHCAHYPTLLRRTIYLTTTDHTPYYDALRALPHLTMTRTIHLTTTHYIPYYDALYTLLRRTIHLTMTHGAHYPLTLTLVRRTARTIHLTVTHARRALPS